MSAVACALLLFSTSLFAQNSAVSGTVADASGALIPGVSVTATNTQTGVVTTVISNEAGAYNLASLQPGTYKVTAELPGFQTQTYNNYQVEASQQLRLNFSMQVASVAQGIEVTIDASTLIATSASSIGQVLAESKVRELPLVGTNALDLISIMPGVVGENFAGVSQMAVNTVRDGLSVSDGRFNNGVFATTVVNPDLVGEMRLILTPVDAELGRGNGQVQITTRSGTNRYTGSAVWNLRNSAFDANTWDNNNDIDTITGKWNPTVPNWQNNHQYSLSLGGPIKKNKTFFYALWDQQLNYQRQLITGSVLTDSARQGIFRYFDNWNNGNANSTTTTTGATPITAVVDFQGNPRMPSTNPNGTPFTGALRCFSIFGDRKVDGSPFTQADCPGGTAIIGSPWDTRRTALDPTGYIARVLTQMPRANYFATGDGLNRAGYRWILHRRGNSGANVTTGNDLDTDRTQINIKIDHNFNSTHKLSVGYTRERNQADSDIPNWPNGINFGTHRWPQVLTTNFTSTLSSSLLNEARFGIRYMDAGIDAPWEEQIGDDAIVEAARNLMLPGSKDYLALVSPGAGNYAFGGSANGFMNTNPGQYNGNKSPLYSYADTLSYTQGKHAYKFGAELRFTESRGYNNSPAGGGALILYPRITGGAGGQNSPLINPITALTGLTGTATTGNRADVANMLYFMAGSVNSVSQTYWINSYDDVKNGTWHDTNDLSTGRRKYRPVAQNEWSLFFKDDWKATSRLTLNLGLRYEFYGSPYVPTGFTSTSIDQGAGLFGIGRAGDDIFGNWLQPGSPIYLSGYGPNATLANALVCNSGVSQAGLPASSCDPNKLTSIEFIGPKTPNPGKVAVRNDRNNFGPAVGFAWQVPFLGKEELTLRGGYQVTFGGSGRTVGGGGSTSSEAIIGQAPGSLSSPTTVLADFSGRYLDLRNVAELVPVIPTSPALPGAGVPVFTRSANFSAYDPNFVTPYTQNFTLSATRNLKRNLTLDVRYIGTISKKQTGSFNINTPNVHYNKELFDALEITRRGGDAPLFDQMLAGLNLNNGVTGYGPVGTVVNGVLQTGSAHLRRNATFTLNLANGNYNAVAASLNGNGSNLPTNGTAGGFTNVPAGLAGVGGRLLRNGCDRIASGQGSVLTPNGTLPLRCFPENYITMNPQLATFSATTAGPVFVTNSGSSNYHSLQSQITLRPTAGLSYQATYTWAKNLGIPGTTFTDPLDRDAEYTYTTSHRAHDFRSNGTFELPLGPNKWLLGGSSGWLARIVERWQTSIILNLTSGARDSIDAANMLYANGVPDVVGPFSITKGKLIWGEVADANGQLVGNYFGANTFIKVSDPQCAMTNVTDRNGFNLFAGNNCTIDALADAKTGQIVLQNPLPGKRGNLGRNAIELPGTWRLDANLSKAFRVTEGKTLQFRLDARNVLNHPGLNAPTLDINNNTAFGQITEKNTDRRQFQAQLRLNF